LRRQSICTQLCKARARRLQHKHEYAGARQILSSKCKKCHRAASRTTRADSVTMAATIPFVARRHGILALSRDYHAVGAVERAVFCRRRILDNVVACGIVGQSKVRTREAATASCELHEAHGNRLFTKTTHRNHSRECTGFCTGSQRDRTNLREQNRKTVNKG
jgi:hypothetical protein